MAISTKYRENVTTIRTVEKITLENGKVQKRELHEKPTEHSETDWFDGSYFCITNGHQLDLEKAYQQNQKREIPANVLKTLEWVEEMGDLSEICPEGLLERYFEEMS